MSEFAEPWVSESDSDEQDVDVAGIAPLNRNQNATPQANQNKRANSPDEDEKVLLEPDRKRRRLNTNINAIINNQNSCNEEESICNVDNGNRVDWQLINRLPCIVGCEPKQEGLTQDIKTMQRSIHTALSPEYGDNDDITLTRLTEEESGSFRHYYVSIVGNQYRTGLEKKGRIFEDLVLPFLKQNREKTNNLNEYGTDEFVFRYKIGIETETIEEMKISNNVVCIGHEKGCDIEIFGENARYVSRFHLFILKINDNFIFLDAWSLNGTKILSIESESKDKIQNNAPLYVTGKDCAKIIKCKNSDAIHLKLGKSDLIVNPRTCIVCEDNARTIKTTQCGHFLFCKSCFDEYYNAQQNENKVVECPICRKEIVKDYAVPYISTRTCM